MTKEELEDRLIELCQEYADEQGWKEFNVNFALNVYTDMINPCLIIKEFQTMKTLDLVLKRKGTI